MNYFTKSKFKRALECETRLWYAAKKEEYANKSLDDSFLQALADGGFQVGALAQFMLADDPVGSGLQGKETTNEGGLKETATRLSAQDAVMAEASFIYGNIFVRADMVRKSGTVLDLYEVKAKSFEGTNDEFWVGGRKSIASKWKPYLYDVAFQTWVIRKAHPEWQVNPHLVLADKTRRTDIDGLNQCFKIVGNRPAGRVRIRPGLVRKNLGTMVLTEIEVSEEVDCLLATPMESEAFGVVAFDEYVQQLADAYCTGLKLGTTVGKKCRDCPFRADPGSPEAEAGFKSGFHECWEERQNVKPEAFKVQSVLDLWDFRQTDALISNGIHFLPELAKEPEWRAPVLPGLDGLTKSERQRLQVQKAADQNAAPFLLKQGLAREIQHWKYPLHFIDFETSAPALPFTRGHRPYESIAFQFSMHDVQPDGRIAHAAQFLDDTIGEHPNYRFLRALKTALGKDDGTVFRYAEHENTILSHIRASLLDDPDAPADRDELVGFAESLIHYTDERGMRMQGPRCMVDMRDLVLRFFYHPAMKGSNSIKKVLPAAIASSPHLCEKYSRPIYGTEDIPSFNYSNHAWIDERLDPYKTLPPLFGDLAPEERARLAAELEEFDRIQEGGAAMTAYCLLQFAEVPEAQRVALVRGLLRYCELDTMAMVMIFEYWKHEMERA